LRDRSDKTVAALEWEWSSLHRGEDAVNEFGKLKDACEKRKFPGIRFASLIGYARVDAGRGGFDFKAQASKVLQSYSGRWTKNLPPLLLIVIYFENKGREVGRKFTKMTVDILENGKANALREQPAYPWDVKDSRWQAENAAQPPS
jgi:hypothetical protein